MDNGNDNNNGRRSIGGQGNNYNNNHNNYAKYGGNSSSGGVRYTNNRTPNNLAASNGGNNNRYNSNNNGYNGNNYNQGNNRRVVGGGNGYNQIKGLSDDYNGNNNGMEGGNMDNNENAPLDKKAKKELIKKRVKMGLKIFFLTMLVAIIVGGIFIYVKYGKDIMDMREEAIQMVAKKNKEDFMKSSQHKYYAIKTGDSGQKEYVEIDMGASNNKYISISDGGENMVLARELMVCSEDRKFYSHGGVDLWANVKAVILMIINGGEAKRGGSTITQQLARNVVLEDFDKTWRRKVKEIFVSWELEDKFEKDEIIEFYLNNINFGNGYIGIENASFGYFGKSVKEISKGQVAFLCSIPNNPSLFDPYNLESNQDKKNIAKGAGEYKVNYNTSVRKERLLKQMNKYSKSKLDNADYTAAVSEKIEVLPADSSTGKGNKQKVDYMLKKYIRRCVYDKIISIAYSSEFKYEYPDEWANDAEREEYVTTYNELYTKAENYLKNSSSTLHIYTSIDLDMVAEMQKAIDEGIPQYGAKDKVNKLQTTPGAEKMYLVQGAGVTMDDSGYVVAMVNHRNGQDDTTNHVGRAFGFNNESPAIKSNIGSKPNKEYKIDGSQQPGSAIKPLLVYGPYFEENKDKPGFCFLDEPVEDEDSYTPSGAPKISNSHSVSRDVREAIQVSSNVVAYKILEDTSLLGTRKGLNYLKKLNFNFLASNENTRASIGSTNGGVTPLEMCAAYSYVLMDMATYIRPTCVKVISNKKLLAVDEVDTHSQAKQSGDQEEIFSNDTKSRLIEGMQTVFEGEGTASGNKPSGGWQVAGKTGTTDKNVDAWFCGGTPKYTTAIWVGVDAGNEDSKISGPTVSRIWKNYYNAIGKIGRIKSELDSKPSFTFKYEYEQRILPEPTEDPNATEDPNGEIPMPSETTFTFMPGFTQSPISTDDPDDDDDDDDDDDNPLPTVPSENPQPPVTTPDTGNSNGNSNGSSNGNSNGNINGGGSGRN